MGFYDRHILPRLLDAAMSTKPITYQRLGAPVTATQKGDSYKFDMDVPQVPASLLFQVEKG